MLFYYSLIIQVLIIFSSFGCHFSWKLQFFRSKQISIQPAINWPIRLLLVHYNTIITKNNNLTCFWQLFRQLIRFQRMPSRSSEWRIVTLLIKPYFLNYLNYNIWTNHKKHFGSTYIIRKYYFKYIWKNNCDISQNWKIAMEASITSYTRNIVWHVKLK